MTIIKHSTNPAIFVGTPDEFGLAVEGDFSAAGHWIASVNGQETDLMCLDAEQAMREGERVFEAEAHSLAYTAEAEAALAASRVVPNSDEQKEIELIQSKLTVLREAIDALVDQAGTVQVCLDPDVISRYNLSEARTDLAERCRDVIRATGNFDQHTRTLAPGQDM